MRPRSSTSLENEAGFRVLFQSATIGILVVNEKGNIELSNPCAEKLFGYPVGELIGRDIETLIPDSLRERHIQHRENYFASPRPRPMGVGLELHALMKDGGILPVEISLTHYELDGEKLAVAFVTDISAQVEAKRLLAEREAWFRNMADNAPVMIWVSGADKLHTHFNRTWLEFTGNSMAQEIGTGWVDNIHPEDLDRFLEIFNNAFDRGEPFSVSIRMRRYDGEYRWIECSARPTFSDNGTFTGYIGTCSDIHDERMMKEELERQVRERTTELCGALDREKQMNGMKSRFVSMASHEFRTPLSIVLSSAMLIEQYALSDQRVGKHLARIKSSISNLTTILGDFLSLDRLEQGNVEMENEFVSISKFMEEIAEEVALLLKKDQTIERSHEGDDLVLLDQKKFRYIVINLLSNSVKYSPPGSGIRVSTERDPGKLVLTVEDHGIGIPEGEQSSLFKQFFRAKNTGDVQGTGLGLSIAKSYVDLMGGTISFESKQGSGTRFIVEIPQPG